MPYPDSSRKAAYFLPGFSGRKDTPIRGIFGSLSYFCPNGRFDRNNPDLMWRRFLHSLRQAGEEARLPLLPLLGVCLLFHLWTAYASIGYHHADEHFQILEFANHALKGSPASDLPWEYGERIRPALQPMLAAGFFQALSWLGVDHVIWWNYLLKALTSMISLLTIVLACRLVAPDLSVSGKRALWLSALFLWFMPYLHVRFTSENWSGILFFWATFLVLRRAGEGLPPGRALAIGLLLGLSFVFRFQMAFAILGLGMWLLIRQRPSWVSWVALVAAGVSMIGLGFLVDSWYYGEWVFTPYEYFRVNILEAKAAEFGVSPWYQYFVLFLIHAGPPLSIGLLILFFWGMVRRPQHLWSWAFAVFLLGHLLVGHKELRFLYPMSYLIPFFVALGWEAFHRRAWRFWGWRGLSWFLAGLNVAILGLWLSFFPHKLLGFNEYYLKFLYTYAERQPAENLYLVSLADDPYEYLQLRMNFYESPKLELVLLPDAQALEEWLPTAGRPVLFYRRDGQELPELPGHEVELLYHTFPDWALEEGSRGNELVRKLQEIGADIRIRYVYAIR